MKTILALILGLFSWVSVAGADTTFTPRQFSDFPAALGGVPYPAERFAQSLLDLDSGSSITSSIFPHGRSLERSITDFKQPRSVMIWQSSTPSSPYFLYLAYTPRAEEFEVIAWNWEKRQFDFKLIQDYAPGKTPRVTDAYRPLCMACHQSGGPMFPINHWSETTEDMEIAQRLKDQSEDSLSRYILSLTLDPSIRLRVENSNTDFQVHRGNSLMQNQKICRNICGGDLECRKGLLLSALWETIEHSSSANLPESWLKKMDPAIRKVWPDDAFAIQSFILFDRTVDLEHPWMFDHANDPLNWRSLVFQHDVAEGTSWNLLAAYAQCWSFSPKQVDLLRSWGSGRLDTAMHSQQMTSLVADWLPNEDLILSALSSAVKAPEKIHTPLQVAWSPPVEETGAVSDPTRPRVKTTELFRNYCASCHSDPSGRPPYLPLGDLHALSTYVGVANGDRTVRSLLDSDHPVMPPRRAKQPTVEERRQMISDLR